MSLVRSKGNKSTELKVVAALNSHGISGWVSHPSDVQGRPDFYFPEQRIAIFVNGCFWHGCPKCGRIPKTRVEFWVSKIESTKSRDVRVRKNLRSSGHKVLTVWGHSIESEDWLRRVELALAKS